MSELKEKGLGVFINLDKWGISTFTLKIIAMITMIIDHVGFLFFQDNHQTYIILRSIAVSYTHLWCESTLSRAVKIDNKYITYNKDTDSFDVQLTVWAGDSGTPFEEALYPEVFGENHEDYTVSGLQLKLANGKSYIPTKIEPCLLYTSMEKHLH